MIEAINSVVMRAYLGMKREEGQTFVEYSLIGVVVAVALCGILLTFEGRSPARWATSAARS